MKWRTYTGYFILIAVVAIIVYDFVAIANGGKDASISQYLIDWSYQYPVMPFAFGIVCGHLFWRMPDKEKKDDISKS